MEKNPFHLALRLGLAFAFIYPAVSAWIEPQNWIGYFPSFMKGYVSDAILLHTFGLSEIIVGLWLIVGKIILIPSLIASAYLILIILFNIYSFDIVFRDVSILAISIALAIEARKGNI